MRLRCAEPFACRPSSWVPPPPAQCARRSAQVRTAGATNCTPKINTSEIIVDFQWHFPMDFHLSVAFSKILSFVQWIFTGIVQWTFSGIFQWIFICVISGV